MRYRTPVVLVAVIALCGALALTGCGEQKADTTQPALSRPEGLPASAEDSAVANVVAAFFDAANSGDGDAVNALFGPDMQLFTDAAPSPGALSVVTVGAPVDIDGPLETVDSSGVRGPSSGPQPDRIVTVPVDLEVSGDTPYLALDEGPARVTFTLVLNDGGPWLIHSMHVDQ